MSLLLFLAAFAASKGLILNKSNQEGRTNECGDLHEHLLVILLHNNMRSTCKHRGERCTTNLLAVLVEKFRSFIEIAASTFLNLSLKAICLFDLTWKPVSAHLELGFLFLKLFHIYPGCSA